MSEVIQNLGTEYDLEIRDRIPEFHIDINQNDNWDVVVWDSEREEELKLTFNNPPSPKEILDAVKKTT
jgi:hypothetical protein